MRQWDGRTSCRDRPGFAKTTVDRRAFPSWSMCRVLGALLLATSPRGRRRASPIRPARAPEALVGLPPEFLRGALVVPDKTGHVASKRAGVARQEWKQYGDGHSIEIEGFLAPAQGEKVMPEIE